MAYIINPQNIPQGRREEINKKILYAIDNGIDTITPEVVYNCYTGNGGLHGLEMKDFDNYNEFKKAKMEKEAGQFFTPHETCRLVCEIVDAQEDDRIADSSCGMGNFFNFLPVQENIWGNEIDPAAAKVARFLYPKASISCSDMRTWTPAQKFTIMLLNPPFNLEFEWNGERCLSQMYSCIKAEQMLDTAGLLAAIVPKSFLESLLWNKSDIATMNRLFSFIGQTELGATAFKAVGVERFETKLMLFHKRCESIEHRNYDAAFCSADELRERVKAYKEKKKDARMALIREALTSEDRETGETMYRIRKCLYDIKHNPKTSRYYAKAIEYIEKFRTQEPPKLPTKAELEEWERKKITPEKVLSYCRRQLRKQNIHPKEEIHLVYDRESIRLKGYSARTRKELKETEAKALDRNEAIWSGETPLTKCIPEALRERFAKEAGTAAKRLARERRRYEREIQPIAETAPSESLKTYLDGVSFNNTRKEACRLTDLQKEDLNRIMQKRYALINWQQGSGKTAAAYFFGKRLLEQGSVRNVVILAPALAINLTWIPFMRNNGENFIEARCEADLEKAEKGGFILVSISMAGTIRRAFKRYNRIHLQNKACLLFDECDEITNPNAKRTKVILDMFRRFRYKLLCTGTTTRNNIGELYPQLELLYNNSCLMRCDCPTVYEYDKEGNLNENINLRFGQPFPPRGGSILFNSCYCPGKATVFGIEKFNQDVLNADSLRELTARTITTRKFKEFAGEKYSIDNIRVTPTENEKQVYKKILEELEALIPLYFNETGDSKKEAALKMIRTITLLIRSCSTPQLMPGYNSVRMPTKTEKILNMLEERNEKKVVIGCTTHETLEAYRDYVTERFPFRPIYIIDGSVSFKRRDRILKEFESTLDGLLICTQQSLKSSVNIPTCNEVIIEALQWNIPKIQQFFFRTIRFDSKDWTNVHFVTYENTIEQNIMALLMTKERLNEFLKSGEVQDRDELYKEYGLNEGMLSALMGKEYDENGKVHFTWGSQRISA